MTVANPLSKTESSRLVVDASVVIKWHVPEIYTDEARKLLRDDGPILHVPDLMFTEVGNILWKKIGRQELTKNQVRMFAHIISDAPVEVHAAAPLLEAAVEIAMDTGRTVYDSLYLALAVQLNCRLVTADSKLLNSLIGGPLSSHILWIGDDFKVSLAPVEDVE